nr:Xaa-Pro dipeptidyl-peptidase [Virgibacillus siamensis]
MGSTVSTTSAMSKDTKEKVKLNGLIPSTASDSAEINVKNGMTQPIYSTDNAIIENLHVKTQTDSDRDGENDLVSIKVMRPKTDPGIKVPVIYQMSPYRSGLKSVPYHDVDVELTPAAKQKKVPIGLPFSLMKGKTANLGYLGNYYVPRGYAVILGESIGTGKSDGCPTVGDRKEILGTKAVIDWLNGRTKAFTEDGQGVAADWSTGNVGMVGVSYNGTLPNGVATTGVEGLKTIIPTSAISSWYDYYRANGAVVAPGGYQGEDADILAKAVLTRENPEECEAVIDEIEQNQARNTGDYNDFWDKRNYVKDVENINASVFVVHGLNDWNVKTKQFAQWWKALVDNDVPRKMWLHQGGHGGTSENNYKKTENRWFDYWLYGIENGIMDEPKIDIERENGTWHQEVNWPNNDAISAKFHLKPGYNNPAGTLGLNSTQNHDNYTQNLVDAPQKKASKLISQPMEHNPNRLVYLTPKLTKKVRISGTPKISIRASIDHKVANLTALLVDYGGKEPKIVTRGWMDPQNLFSDKHPISIVPGKQYKFEWDMQPDDYVFQPGHRLGIVLIASDYDYTIRPPAGTEITVNLDQSSISLPIIDGKEGLTFINASDMKKHVNKLMKNGEFKSDKAAHALKIHLTIVHQFEKMEAKRKVVKHMKGFKLLLEHQLQNGLISGDGYETLKDDVDSLFRKWR